MLESCSCLYFHWSSWLKSKSWSAAAAGIHKNLYIHYKLIQTCHIQFRVNVWILCVCGILSSYVNNCLQLTPRYHISNVIYGILFLPNKKRKKEKRKENKKHLVNWRQFETIIPPSPLQWVFWENGLRKHTLSVQQYLFSCEFDFYCRVISFTPPTSFISFYLFVYFCFRQNILGEKW